MDRTPDNTSQFGRPTGETGREILEGMNVHHRELAEWGLSLLPDGDAENILDVGCGGGMGISLLGRKYTGMIEGIDISEEAVGLASSVNSDLIAQGRCHIGIGSVSEIPFPDGMFDVVTAFETYFFWPDLENDVKEVARVTKDGGYAMIVSETYPHPSFDERNTKMIEDHGMNILENTDMSGIMEAAGFKVTAFEVVDKNWVAFIGRRIISF